MDWATDRNNKNGEATFKSTAYSSWHKEQTCNVVVAKTVYDQLETRQKQTRDVYNGIDRSGKSQEAEDVQIIYLSRDFSKDDNCRKDLKHQKPKS